MDFNGDSLSEFCGAKNISDLRYSTSWIHAYIKKNMHATRRNYILKKKSDISASLIISVEEPSIRDSSVVSCQLFCRKIQ